MAGGTWASQNKVRPGVYIRFASDRGLGLTVSDRGVVAIAEAMSWGPVETVQEIESDILSYEGVIGVHDLMVHDYGPGRMFASAHVEVPSDCDIMACHDTIDRIERDIKKKFAINIVLHMDPIVVDDEHINALREKVGELIKEVDPRFTMHDFRMVEGPTHTNLIFDLVVPHKYPFTKGQIKELISDKISTEIGENYYAVMTVENSFVEDERK